MNNAVVQSVSLSENKSVQTILKVLRRATGLRAVMIGEAGEKVERVQAVADDSGFGLKPGDELDPANTYCQTVWKTGNSLRINHASADARFSDHPGVTVCGIESYLGVPIYKKNGELFGNLCAFDTVPAELAPENVELFELFAELITHEIEAEAEKNLLAQKLENAQETSEIRARFMSILGHDLRNPLNTVMMAAKIQAKSEQADDFSRDLSQKIIKSAQRMQKMIRDLLDTTRTEQLITLPFAPERLDLCTLFGEIVEEFRLSHPAQTIEFAGDQSCEGSWDAGRTVQVFSNLLSNALYHSRADSPVKIFLRDTGETVRVSVWNRGKLIASDEMENIFQPFWRGKQESSASSDGLGLGLHIVQEIMHSHGGRIEVESTEGKGTTFTAVFPK